MMTEPERLNFLIKNLESGSGQKFAQRVGMSTTALYRMRKGDYSIRLKIDDITATYPAINRHWLETGEGYPGDLSADLVKSHLEKKIKRQEEIIDKLLSRIDDLEKRLETNL